MKRHLLSIPFMRPSVMEKEIKNAFDILIADQLHTSEMTEKFNEELKSLYPFRNVWTFFSYDLAMFLIIHQLQLTDQDSVILSVYHHQKLYDLLKKSGVKVILLDVDKESGMMTVENIESNIQNQTKAVFLNIPFSGAQNLEEYLRLNCVIIFEMDSLFGLEWDAALYDSQKVITIVDFKDNSLISLGGNGCSLLTMSSDFDQYSMDFIDFQITDIQATIGLSQLSKIKDLLDRRRQIAQEYSKTLSQNQQNVKNNYLYYPVYDEKSLFEENENIFKNNGVEIHQRYSQSIIHQQKELTPLFPHAYLLEKHIFCLPIYPTLSHEEVKLIKTILNYLF